MDAIKVEVAPPGDLLTIRQGQALPLKEPEKIELSGTITAPGDWVAKRGPTIVTDNAHVIADYEARSITLYIDEANYYGPSITGVLDLDPELGSFHINENHLRSQTELRDFLKFKRAYFKSPDAHATMMSKLRAFEAKVETEILNADNMKGSIAEKKITEISTNLDLSFTLAMPVFGGGDPLEFTVDIMVGMQGGVKFWFESPDLYDYIKTQTAAIFKSELDRLSAFAIVRRFS